MRRIIALILSIIMCIGCGITASAADDYNTDFTSSSQQDDIVVTPRYTYLTSMSAGIAKEALGFVTCTSTYTCMYEGFTYTLTCTLQRTDGSATGWVNYKSETKTFTEIGSRCVEKLWFAPAGYAYRTHTKIVIKNASGTVVESATGVSPTIYK
ncbi:MAG: hypothetical protein U0K91_01225 [Acutalibacteraceae bacterium]|nr:hypothetical protein [Acutalibacteraceae bacterium]